MANSQRHREQQPQDNPFMRLVPKLAAPNVALPVMETFVEETTAFAQALVDANIVIYRQWLTMGLRVMGSMTTAVREADEE